MKSLIDFLELKFSIENNITIPFPQMDIHFKR